MEAEEIKELKQEIIAELRKPVRSLEDRLDLQEAEYRELKQNLKSQQEDLANAHHNLSRRIENIESDRGVDANRRDKERQELDNLNKQNREDADRRYSDINSAIGVQHKMIADLDARLKDLQGCAGDSGVQFEQVQKLEGQVSDLASELKKKLLEMSSYVGKHHSDAIEKLKNTCSYIDEMKKFFDRAVEYNKAEVQELKASLKVQDLKLDESFQVHQSRSNEAFAKLDAEVRGVVAELSKKHHSFHEEIRDLERKFVRAARDRDVELNIEDFIKQVRYNTKQLARLAKQIEGSDGDQIS